MHDSSKTVSKMRKFKNGHQKDDLKTVKKERIASSDSDLGKTFNESLILAQDERWRRA